MKSDITYPGDMILNVTKSKATLIIQRVAKANEIYKSRSPVQSQSIPLLYPQLQTPTIAWALTPMSPGRRPGVKSNATPTTTAAHAVTQLNLFSGCAASALQHQLTNSSLQSSCLTTLATLSSWVKFPPELSTTTQPHSGS